MGSRQEEGEVGGPPPATAACNTKGGGDGTDGRAKNWRVFGFFPAQADLRIAREDCAF